MFETADSKQAFWRWPLVATGLFLLISLFRIFTGLTPDVNSLVFPFEFPNWLGWIPAAVNAGLFVMVFLLLTSNKKSRSMLKSLDNKDDHIVAVIAALVMSLVFSNIYSMTGIIAGSLLIGILIFFFLDHEFDLLAVLSYMVVIGWSHNLLVQTTDHYWTYSLFVSPFEAVFTAIISVVAMLLTAVVIYALSSLSVYAFRFAFPEEDEKKYVPEKLEPRTPNTEEQAALRILKNARESEDTTPTKDSEPNPDAEYTEAGIADKAALDTLVDAPIKTGDPLGDVVPDEMPDLLDGDTDGPEKTEAEAEWAPDPIHIDDEESAPADTETEITSATKDEEITPVETPVEVTPPVETGEDTPAEETADKPVENPTDETEPDKKPA
ncbi:hypothetical protein HOB10_05385 [Candidatus Parcubacteria bacterium]|nr:hypothetical protein [Candidatus Parcubacteria bacterium]